MVRGEAESTMELLVPALEQGRTGLVIEEPFKPDLGTSPIPRWDLIDVWDYSMIYVQTSRGCPFDCEFCDIVNLYGRKPRYKSPDQFLSELEALYRLGYRGSIFISDDNFIGDRRKALALVNALIPWMENRGKPFGFFCQASINLGQEPELVDLMTEACICDVFIGIETPDEDALRKTNKVQNVRRPLVENLDYLARNGMSILGSFIIGLDGEKPGAGQRLCDFVEETAMPRRHDQHAGHPAQHPAPPSLERGRTAQKGQARHRHPARPPELRTGSPGRGGRGGVFSRHRYAL